jgi:hypothetical protein
MLIKVIIYWEDGETTSERIDSEGYREYLEEKKAERGFDIVKSWIEA